MLSKLATTYYDQIPEGVLVEMREEPSFQSGDMYALENELEDWRTPII